LLIEDEKLGKILHYLFQMWLTTRVPTIMIRKMEHL